MTRYDYVSVLISDLYRQYSVMVSLVNVSQFAHHFEDKMLGYNTHNFFLDTVKILEITKGRCVPVTLEHNTA